MRYHHFEYEPDIIDYYPTPVDFYKQCLYLRKQNNERSCYYKDVKITLSPHLFDKLFMLAEDTSKTHRLDCIEKLNGAGYDNERQIKQRINSAFKKAGFTENIVIKVQGAGYRIDLDVIPADFIITAHK